VISHPRAPGSFGLVFFAALLCEWFFRQSNDTDVVEKTLWCFFSFLFTSHNVHRSDLGSERQWPILKPIGLVHCANRKGSDQFYKTNWHGFLISKLENHFHCS